MYFTTLTGPNPLHPTQTIADSIFGSTSYLYYEGHGMLHAVYFNKSNLGEWKISYRNKCVKSDTFQLEGEKNELAFVPSADGEPYATLVAFVLNIVSLAKLDSKNRWNQLVNGILIAKRLVMININFYEKISNIFFRKTISSRRKAVIV